MSKSVAIPENFTVTATDVVGNTATKSVMHTVSYNVCLEYDPAQPTPVGAVAPIRINLCDANSADVGSNAVTATGVSPSGVLQSPAGAATQIAAPADA